MVCTRRKVLFDWGKNTMEKVIKTKRGFNDTKKIFAERKKEKKRIERHLMSAHLGLGFNETFLKFKKKVKYEDFELHSQNCGQTSREPIYGSAS